MHNFFFTPYGGMDITGLPLPTWLDLSAVIVGALAGVFTARQRKLDLVGYVGLAMICGLGGGLIRDTILQKGSVYMMDSPYAIPMAVLTGLIGFFFPGATKRFSRFYEWVDIVSVSLFAVAGADKAIMFHTSGAAVILLSTITAVGGGMLRDVFLGEVPQIFRRSNLYAICSVIGGALYYSTVCMFGVRKLWALIICVFAMVAMRRWSLKYNVLSPDSIDLSPRASKAIRLVYTVARNEGRRRGETIIKKPGSHRQ